MNEKSVARERVLWTAAVAVLASSLAWLGMIALGLLLGSRVDRFATVLVVLKVMARAGLALAVSAWPLALAALVAAGLMLMVAQGPRGENPVEKQVRHA